MTLDNPVTTKIGACLKCKKGFVYEFPPIDRVQTIYTNQDKIKIITTYTNVKSFCGNALCNFNESNLIKTKIDKFFLDEFETWQDWKSEI